jgi:formamidopyrimidine-DNA glycosylase
MPELPEVETVKNEIIPHVVGRTITGISLLWEGIVKEPSPEEFCSGLIGQKILGISRRGKYMIVSLSSPDYLILHLKMTGSLLVQRSAEEPPKFTRAIIHLDDGKSVFFRDPRKFGAMRLVRDPDRIIGKLGPEPLEADFTPEILAERLANRKAPMKAVLCDQNIIAGIGSMYADEALFATGIHPMRSADSLSKKEINRLYEAIRRILQTAIENKGASVNTYYRPDGSKGSAHYEFKVAHCGGKSCVVCGKPVERIVVRGRGSYYCPNCQPIEL